MESRSICSRHFGPTASLEISSAHRDLRSSADRQGINEIVDERFGLRTSAALWFERAELGHPKMQGTGEPAILAHLLALL
jgi:hypothetical protein